MSSIVLNCYVVDDDPNQVFRVELSSTDTVSDLKKAIKAEKSHTFKNVDADALRLWRALLPVDSKLKELKLRVIDRQSLSPIEELSEVFSTPLSRRMVHVIIKPPSVELPNSLLYLNCYVLGDSPQQIFLVKVASTETVSALKKAIKAEKSQTFQYIDADTLQLWSTSASIDLGSSCEECIVNLNFINNEAMSPVENLSTVFTAFPIEKHVHVVVKPPFLDRDVLSSLLAAQKKAKQNSYALSVLDHKTGLEKITEDPKTHPRPPNREPNLPLTMVKPSSPAIVDDLITDTSVVDKGKKRAREVELDAYLETPIANVTNMLELLKRKKTKPATVFNVSTSSRSSTDDDDYNSDHNYPKKQTEIPTLEMLKAKYTTTTTDVGTFFKFTDDDRCARCRANGVSECIVQDVGYRKMVMWINDNQGSAVKSPNGSACHNCRRAHSSFCRFPIVDKVKGFKWRKPRYAQTISEPAIVMKHRETRSVASSSEKKLPITTVPTPSTLSPELVTLLHSILTNQRKLLADQEDWEEAE